jgi:hypothetical protein
MTRTDYIAHLENLRKAVANIIAYDMAVEKAQGKAILSAIEDERRKKTSKMLFDLHVRLYEDGAVSERQRREAYINGDYEQAELTFDIPMGDRVKFEAELNAFADTVKEFTKEPGEEEAAEETAPAEEVQEAKPKRSRKKGGAK